MQQLQEQFSNFVKHKEEMEKNAKRKHTDDNPGGSNIVTFSSDTKIGGNHGNRNDNRNCNYNPNCHNGDKYHRNKHWHNKKSQDHYDKQSRAITGKTASRFNRNDKSTPWQHLTITDGTNDRYNNNPNGNGGSSATASVPPVDMNNSKNDGWGSFTGNNDSGSGWGSTNSNSSGWGKTDPNTRNLADSAGATALKDNKGENGTVVTADTTTLTTASKSTEPKYYIEERYTSQLLEEMVKCFDDNQADQDNLKDILPSKMFLPYNNMYWLATKKKAAVRAVV